MNALQGVEERTVDRHSTELGLATVVVFRKHVHRDDVKQSIIVDVANITAH